MSMESPRNVGQYYRLPSKVTDKVKNGSRNDVLPAAKLQSQRASLSTVTSPHSGHFMTSNLEDDDDYVDGLGRGLGVEGPDPAEAVSTLMHKNYPKKGYNFEDACKTPRGTYRFNSRGNKAYFKDFDDSLSKLFACMSLAYNGKLTTPKFKAFKGLKINVWDKMRLNNIIWREWHLQFIQKHKPAVCSFTIHMDDTHREPQAVVLEGKYWKRKLDIVCVEYQKWRIFYKKKLMPKKKEKMGIQELLDRVADTDSHTLTQSINVTQATNQPHITSEVGDNVMDFSDAFFASLSQTNQSPHIKDDLYYGFSNADIIQPNLVGLQPSLDEFVNMDTMEPFQDLFNDAFGFGTSTQQPQHIGGSLNNLAALDHIPVTPQGSSPPLFTGSQSNSFQHSANFPFAAPQLTHSAATHAAAYSTLPSHTQSLSDSVYSFFLDTLVDQGQTTQSTNQLQAGWHNSSTTILMPPPTLPHTAAVSPSATVTPTTTLPLAAALQNTGSSKQSPQYTKTSSKKPRTIAPKVMPSPFLTQLLTSQKSRHLPTLSPKVSLPANPVKVSKVKSMVPDLVAISGNKQTTLTAISQLTPTGLGKDKEVGRGAADEVFQLPKVSEKKELSAVGAAAVSPAEQKRRGHMKNGFETLQMIVPALANNPTTKVSKAAMLNKTAEFAQKLKTERQEMQTESDLLQKEIEALNAAIGSCQQQLPATGVPITSQNNEQMQQMLRAYIQERTTQNWKFYIFSKLATPLFESFNSVVSTAGTDELYRTTHSWLDHHCTLPALRTAVLNSLRTICKETSILSEPERFPEEAQGAVSSAASCASNSLSPS